MQGSETKLPERGDGPPQPTLPFIDLGAQQRRLDGAVERAIAAVLAHGQYVMGPEVAELEERLSTFCGARHALGCASGTDALLLGLMALGVGPGDAVLVPSFTFVATAEAVALVGAVPVFVDVLPETFALDPDELEAGLTTAGDHGLTPRGVIAVDLFGLPADYDRIEPFCVQNDLWLLADAAQSFGADYRGRRAGAIGTIAATSFFPAKPLGCYGDGGAVFTGDDGLAEIMHSLRVHGQGRDKYDNVRIGINGRLDTLQAAILLEKLSMFPDEIEARQEVATRYGEGFAELGERCRPPVVPPGLISVFAQYTVVLEPGVRDGVAASLRADGIPSAIYYPIPLHRQTGYCHFPVAGGGLPCSDDLAARVLSLPMHPYLAPADQDRIVAALRHALA